MSADSQQVTSLRKALSGGSGWRPTTVTSASSGPRRSQRISKGREAAKDSFLSQSRPADIDTISPVRSFIVISKNALSRLQGLVPMPPTTTVARARCWSPVGSRTSTETATCLRVQLGSLPLACSTVVVDPVVVDPEVALFGDRSPSTPAKTTSATTAPTMTQVNRAGFNLVGTQACQGSLIPPPPSRKLSGSDTRTLFRGSRGPAT
jgi:hypothetical protein